MYLLAAGLTAGDIRLDRRVDMRYRGQGYELEVPLPDAPLADIHARLPELFAQRYRDVFHITLDEPLEIVSWKVEAVGPEPVLADVLADAAEISTVPAAKGTRKAWFPAAGGLIDCPVFDRYALKPGASVRGPALIEEHESTCLLDVDDVGTIDPSYNIRVDIAVAAGKGAA